MEADQEVDYVPIQRQINGPFTFTFTFIASGAEIFFFFVRKRNT
jgi:hypothetical protein